MCTFVSDEAGGLLEAFHSLLHLVALSDVHQLFSPSLLVQPAAGSVPSAEQQQTVSAQLGRIHVLFRRQLGIPLLGKNL